MALGICWRCFREVVVEKTILVCPHGELVTEAILCRGCAYEVQAVTNFMRFTLTGKGDMHADSQTNAANVLATSAVAEAERRHNDGRRRPRSFRSNSGGLEQGPKEKAPTTKSIEPIKKALPAS